MSSEFSSKKHRSIDELVKTSRLHDIEVRNRSVGALLDRRCIYELSDINDKRVVKGQLKLVFKEDPNTSNLEKKNELSHVDLPVTSFSKEIKTILKSQANIKHKVIDNDRDSFQTLVDKDHNFDFFLAITGGKQNSQIKKLLYKTPSLTTKFKDKNVVNEDEINSNISNSKITTSKHSNNDELSVHNSNSNHPELPSTIKDVSTHDSNSAQSSYSQKLLCALDILCTTEDNKLAFFEKYSTPDLAVKLPEVVDKWSEIATQVIFRTSVLLFFKKLKDILIDIQRKVPIILLSRHPNLISRKSEYGAPSSVNFVETIVSKSINLLPNNSQFFSSYNEIDNFCLNILNFTDTYLLQSLDFIYHEYDDFIRYGSLDVKEWMYLSRAKIMGLKKTE